MREDGSHGSSEALSSFISETLIIYNLALVEEEKDFNWKKRRVFSSSFSSVDTTYRREAV